MFGFGKKKKLAAEKAAAEKAAAEKAAAEKAAAEKAAAEKAAAVKKEAPKAEKAPAKKSAAPKKEAPKAEDTVSLAKKGMYEIKRAGDGRYMFNIRAGNTQVIASSQMYTSMASCRNGIKSVGVNAPIAPIEDQTLATVNKEKCPKFQIYFDKAGKYRFNLLAANGDNILSCTQGYTQKASCKGGINSVIANSDATVVILENDD